MLSISKLLRFSVLVCILVMVTGCSQYSEPAKEAPHAQLQADGIQISKIDGQMVSSSTYRIPPGMRDIEFVKAGPQSGAYSQVVQYWSVKFNAKAGKTYTFSARGRDIFVTDTTDNKTYKLTTSGASLASDSESHPAAPLTTGNGVRILSANATSVGGRECATDFARDDR